MTKPKVIGWVPDYTRDAPRMPEITIDHDGKMSIPQLMQDLTGHVYEGQRVIESDEVDAFMHHYGWKPQYAPRQFRARRVHRGYLLTCRDCGISSPCEFPHDGAQRHRCNR